MLPKNIGRYAVQKLLGEGGQGAVLLALDTELDRRVALKLLHPSEQGTSGALASEARIISRLQHPNVVTLFDVGSHEGSPYLVLEFIDGESLQARIARQGKLPFSDSIILASQILAGVAYLHEHDVVHRDLTPANILITKDGVPKVTDFGLSVFQQRFDASEEVVGTLRYMAPEVLMGDLAAAPSDVFAMGSIFYEMLTGTRRFNGKTYLAITSAIVEGPAIDACAHGLTIDAQVAAVLTSASAPSPLSRYPDARAMKSALDRYRLPRQAPSGSDEAFSEHSTVEFLMRRIERKKGFSSLSQHISEIFKLTSEESAAPAGKLVNVLAKDITLSQRVLSFANSAALAAGVKDLPGAVLMLGLERVRMCVTTALMEKQFELGSDALRTAMLSSFHSALLAKALAQDCGLRNGSDAFTSAMFHDLGRTLTIHYLEDEFADIVAQAERRHGDELTESRSILGIAYHELGIGVGNQWRLADTILQCMVPLPRTALPAPKTLRERLHGCVAFANAASHLLLLDLSSEERCIRMQALLEQVEDAFDLSTHLLDTALSEVAPLAAKYAGLIRLTPKGNARITGLTAHTPILAPEGPD